MIKTLQNAFVNGERQLGRIASIPPSHAIVIRSYSVNFHRSKALADMELRRLIMPNYSACQLMDAGLAGESLAFVALRDCLLESGQAEVAETVLVLGDVLEHPTSLKPVRLDLLIWNGKKQATIRWDTTDPQQPFHYREDNIIVPHGYEVSLVAVGSGVWGSAEWSLEDIELSDSSSWPQLGQLRR